VVELHVRRFRYRENACSRATFVEQIDGLTFRYGRRSSGLQTVLQRLAVMLAGRAGARLAKALTVAVSRSTLLRLIRTLPDPVFPSPRVLGVDESALRKGNVYTTLLVDVETRKPVDLLPDRSVATVSGWLAARSGIEIICRDRSSAYAEAGRLGAPDAVHVADRWHIWKNLAEAVEKTVTRHRALLRTPQDDHAVVRGPVELPAGAGAEQGLRTSGRLSDRVRRQHATVHELIGKGMSLRGIARELQVSRTTVRRLARAATADELLAGKWTNLPSILDGHKPYLHQRWAQSCTNATRLFHELRERGYQGGTTVVRHYVQQLREAFPHPGPPRRDPSVRDVTGWLTHHPDTLDEDELGQLKELQARCPALTRTAEHVRAFAELMNNRQGQKLHGWIADVRNDDLLAFHVFAGGLGHDLDAVVAGLTLPYSSGVVEGHNNKIKMLKRQMFGRANFDLLRKRVLLEAAASRS